MPLTRGLAEFNKHATNKVTRLVAGWAPGFAIVHHVGRKTGNVYDTPVNVFERDDEFLFALTYGAGASWVRNVVAAKGCSVTTRRKTFQLENPRVFTDPTRAGIPNPARWILGLIDVDELMTLQVVPDD